MFRHLKSQSFGKVSFTVEKKLTNELFKTQKKFQSNMNNPFNMLPTTTRRIVIANCIFFGAGLFMNNRQYITELFYHKYALMHGKYHVLITSHFAKANLFDFAIETLLTGLLGTQLEVLLGAAAFQKLILSAMGISSILMITMHKDDTFFKSEAIFRSLIMYFVFSNPNQSFYLFPLPIQIKAMYLGIFVVFMDYISGRWANFGGTFAALLVARRLI